MMKSLNRDRSGGEWLEKASAWRIGDPGLAVRTAEARGALADALLKVKHYLKVSSEHYGYWVGLAELVRNRSRASGGGGLWPGLTVGNLIRSNLTV